MKWIKKHKKLVIILSIIIILLVALVLYIRKATKEAMSTLEAMTSSEQATVERRDLLECISATGVVASIDSKTVTAKVTGVPITEVKVAVGDMVKAGDILCTMDSTDLVAAKENAEKGLEAAKSSTDLSLSSANRQLSDAKTTRDIYSARNEENLKSAQIDLDRAKAKLDEASTYYKNAIDERERLEGELNNANQKANEALIHLNNLIGDFPSYEAALQDLQTRLENAKNEEKQQKIKEKIEKLTAAKVAYDAAAAAQMQINLQFNAAQGSEEANKLNLESVNTMYEAQVKAYRSVAEGVEDMQRSQNSTVASVSDSVKSAQISASTGFYAQEQAVDTYQEQIDACTVTAPIGGVVTAVMVNAGDDYMGTMVATIEDISSFEVSAQIEEYDISKIAVGQKVAIKTNATGDTILDGVVKSVAPKATQSMGVGSVTYEVVVSILTPCEDLRLDMTAKLSFIVQESTGVLSVPYEAVQQADDGSYYVEVVDDTAVKTGNVVTSGRKVTVTKGIESNYYIEIISDEIQEGMTILVPKAQAFDFATLIENSMYGY